jgi:hypothetical protein
VKRDVLPRDGVMPLELDEEFLEVLQVPTATVAFAPFGPRFGRDHFSNKLGEFGFSQLKPFSLDHQRTMNEHPQNEADRRTSWRTACHSCS